MDSYIKIPPTRDELDSWKATGYDPRTGKKIKKKSELHKYLKKQFKSLKAPKSVLDDDGDGFGNVKMELKKKSGEISDEEKSQYMLNGRTIVYDDTTMKTYVTARKAKFDLLTYEKINSDVCFEYPYQWDPYTGEPLKDREGNLIKDPYGPLCFNVNTLIKWFHHSRLNMLWISPNGEYEGHFGDALGTSKEINIVSRGANPDKYVFRLPIIDCYLTDDHNCQIPTMGPVLSDRDIAEIYDKARHNVSGGVTEYKRMYKSHLPDIVRIKTYYDLALNPTPPIESDESELTDAELTEERYKKNMMAVEMLKNM